MDRNEEMMIEHGECGENGKSQEGDDEKVKISFMAILKVKLKAYLFL